MRPLSRLALAGLLLSATLTQTGCGYIRYLIPLTPSASGESAPLTHEAYTELLKKYVDERGMVNYRTLQQDSATLNSYLREVSTHLPTRNWTDNDRLAYFINAYNAFTLQRIIRAYPVKSIKDLGGPKTLVNSVWDQDFITLGDKQYTLNDIEHRVIRNNYKDNRIHVALVCAAMSCPRLRREAYVGPQLNAQLNDQADHFVNNPAKNDLTPPDAPTVSSIFNFFPKDFRKNGSTSIQDFINQHAAAGKKIKPDATLKFKEYDWSLNEQK